MVLLVIDMAQVRSQIGETGGNNQYYRQSLQAGDMEAIYALNGPKRSPS
jgi:hypothetical protein